MFEERHGALHDDAVAKGVDSLEDCAARGGAGLMSGRECECAGEGVGAVTGRYPLLFFWLGSCISILLFR